MARQQRPERHDRNVLGGLAQRHDRRASTLACATASRLASSPVMIFKQISYFCSADKTASRCARRGVMGSGMTPVRSRPQTPPDADPLVEKLVALSQMHRNRCEGSWIDRCCFGFG
jgi:hypothetical protein